MSEIEKAIILMQNCKNPACTTLGLGKNNALYDLAIEALKEKQEREKGCPECDTNCHNCKHDVYDDFCRYYGTHGCDKKHFEPKSKFCPMCGRKLGKNNE